MPTLNKQVCGCCGQTINERQIALFKGMVDALSRVYRWSLETGRHEFERKDIKHLFSGNENIIARFGDWVLFGGLVYRPEVDGKDRKGHYGLNLNRIDRFFKGELAIPTLVVKSVDGKLEMRRVRTIKDIPNLGQFLDEYKQFIVKYGQPAVI